MDSNFKLLPDLTEEEAEEIAKRVDNGEATEGEKMLLLKFLKIKGRPLSKRPELASAIEAELD